MKTVVAAALILLAIYVYSLPWPDDSGPPLELPTCGPPKAPAGISSVKLKAYGPRKVETYGDTGWVTDCELVEISPTQSSR